MKFLYSLQDASTANSIFGMTDIEIISMECNLPIHCLLQSKRIIGDKKDWNETILSNPMI